MKVLIISNMRPSVQQPYSGIFVINQYHELQKKLGESLVELFTLERTFTGSLGSIIKYIKIFIRFIPSFFKKYDVIHVHFLVPFILLASAYRFFHPRARVVVTFHGSDISVHMKNKFNRYFFGKLARGADYTIAVGNDLARETKEKLGFSPNLVMCAGIDKKVFYPEHGQEKKYDFIFVGSFYIGKGVDILAEAIRLLNRKDIRFCLAGNGPFLKQFQELSLSYSIDIKEKQTQEQLRKLYNQSKYFVLPSRSEAFGLVATEAMYCGLPALLSYVGGLKDQLQENVNGFYLYELSGIKLMELMQKAIHLSDEEYKLMSENAKKSNMTFSMEHVIQKTISIYSDITGISVAT